MRISTNKFRIATVVCVYLLLAVAVFIGTLLSTPEANQRLLQGVRAIPDWLCCGFMLLNLTVCAFILKLFWLDLPQATARVKSLAEQVAKQKWYVKEAAVIERKIAQLLDSRGWREIKRGSPGKTEGGMLKLSSVDPRRRELTLPIRPAHPSVKGLRQLTYLDIVEFEFVEKSLECALDTELCAYLVLKTEVIKSIFQR